MDLEAEIIEGEVDEYWREIYKIQKVFNNKLKRMQADHDERERDRKKRKKYNADEAAGEDDKPEPELMPPAALTVCNVVQDHMSDFKENIPLISVMCNKGMRPRHWTNMSDIVGYDITPDSGSTLRKMLKLNLTPFMDQFETISAAATKVTISSQLCMHIIISHTTFNSEIGKLLLRLNLERFISN